jgi:uncharacterized damage-inducible protein DinB
MDLFTGQYEWIQRTRESLFEYCEGLSSEDYRQELASFGGDSIRDLHLHVVNCYRIWLGCRALGQSLPEVMKESVNTVEDMREIFRETDALIQEFLEKYAGNWDHTVKVTFRSGDCAEFTALWLFTHTITHEFHHKGQIVKIGRQLGYTPPDTDLIEPEPLRVN